MKKLEEITYPVQCRSQIEEFRAWLAANDQLSERNDIAPYFRARPQMAAMFTMFNIHITRADRMAWEFDIFGDFACDLVVGEWDRGEYCFVEFEDARTDSIFKKQGKKATREWGPRYEHGYSQIADWAHKLDTRSPSIDLLGRFGRHEINYEAVLVIGRDKHLDAGETQRWTWRNNSTLMNSKKVVCMTFDELLSQFLVRLSMFAVFGTGSTNPGVSTTTAPVAAPAPPPTRKPRKGKP
jgi:hypothetical protein